MSKVTCVVLETSWCSNGKHYRVAALADPETLYTRYHDCGSGLDGKMLNLVEVYRHFSGSKVFPTYQDAVQAAYEDAPPGQPVLIFLPSFPNRAEVQAQALNDFDASVDRLSGGQRPVTHDELKEYLYRLVNLLELFREQRP